MSIITWFKSLFGKKQKCNIMLLSSKNQPTYEVKNGSTFLHVDNNKISIKNDTAFLEGSEFVPVDVKFITDDFKPKMQLWAIIFNKKPNGKKKYSNIRYQNKKNEWKWAEDRQELIEEILVLIEEAKKKGEDIENNKEANAERPENGTKVSPDYVVDTEEKATTNAEEKAEKETPREIVTPQDKETPKEIEVAKEQDTSDENENPQEEDTPGEAEGPTEMDKENALLLNLKDLIKMTGMEDIKDQSVEGMLKTLRSRIDNLKKNQKTEAEAKASQKWEEKLQTLKNNSKADLENADRLHKMELKGAENKRAELQKENDQLKAENTELSKTNDGLIKDKVELSNKNENLSATNNDLKAKVDALQSENENLKATDAGQLTEQVKQVTAARDAAEIERDKVLSEIEKKEADIEKKTNKINDLEKKKEELTGKLTERNNELQKTANELNSTKELLNKHQEKIDKLEKEKTGLEIELLEKKDSLVKTGAELYSSKKQITTLQATIGANEIQIKKLESDLKTANEENAKKEGVLKLDVAALLSTYENAANAFVKAVENDFLSECNSSAETDTIDSMCKKIRKGIDGFAAKIKALAGGKHESTTALSAAYDAIIQEAIESNAFMEIARWWAYSRLPFVANRDREEGRAVDFKAISEAFAAETRLLDLAGYRYQLPALFVENLKEGDYENKTGEEQLNLDYQYPNVRRHAENIDRDDRKDTIIDIVQLGYYKDGRLEKKTSVII